MTYFWVAFDYVMIQIEMFKNKKIQLSQWSSKSKQIVLFEAQTSIKRLTAHHKLPQV